MRSTTNIVKQTIGSIMFKSTILSPVGELHGFANESGLHALLWQNEMVVQMSRDANLVSANEHPIFKKLEKQLQEYFSGSRQRFDIPVCLQGTDFQKAAWRALAEIPYGETRSYRQQAAAIGRPKAIRAIGAANGRNPIPILFPCHRVIGADGSLTGFGGGIDNKKFLLALESKNTNLAEY